MAEQLKKKLKEKIEAFRPRTTKLNKELAEIVIDKVTIGQCIGGARDIRSLVTDISYLDPQEGIRFREKTIPETFDALKAHVVPGCEMPTVESSSTSSSPARSPRRSRRRRSSPTGRSARRFPST